MKPCLVISLNSSPVLQACGKPSSHLVESSGEIGETGKGSGATNDAFERQLCFLSGLSQPNTLQSVAKVLETLYRILAKWPVNFLRIISHWPVTSSYLKQERSFIRRSLSRFLQLFLVMVFRARQGRLLGSVIHLLFRWLNKLFWKGRGAGAQRGSGHKAARVDCYVWKNQNVESLPHYLPWLVYNYSSWVFHN